MDSSESSDNENFDPDEEIDRDFEAEKNQIISNLLPKKSRAQYELAYSYFLKWKDENKVPAIDETSLIIYFKELSQKRKPSTLWSTWSKLRTTLSLRHNVNLNDFSLLKSFMKNESKGYKPKKSKILSWSEIKKFLETSDDNIYLAIKVILILGIFGAMRCNELVNLTCSDLEDSSNHYVVTIGDTKNDYPRSFVIGKEFYTTVKKYANLRPSNMPSNRFLVQYNNGACIRQFIGKNKIRDAPKTIALYLNLDDVDGYTGHCFRRSSATALSSSGANLSMVKQLGGWRSDHVVQGYIENSLANRKAIFENITNSGQYRPVLPSVPLINKCPDSAVNNQNWQMTEQEPLGNEEPSTIVPSSPQQNLNTAGKNNNFCGQKLKKRKMNTEDQEIDQLPHELLPAVFKNCEIHNLTINYNNNYSCKNVNGECKSHETKM